MFIKTYTEKKSVMIYKICMQPSLLNSLLLIGKDTQYKNLYIEDGIL